MAIRNREYLAAVKPDGLFLLLELMHFAQEVLDPGELRAASAGEVSAKELEMAKTLIASMTNPWEPEKYQDQYQTALRSMLDAKVRNAPTVKKAKRQPAEGNIVDLLAVLQESILSGKKAPKATGVRETKPRSTSTLVKQKRRAAV